MLVSVTLSPHVASKARRLRLSLNHGIVRLLPRPLIVKLARIVHRQFDHAPDREIGPVRAKNLHAVPIVSPADPNEAPEPPPRHALPPRSPSGALCPSGSGQTAVWPVSSFKSSVTQSRIRRMNSFFLRLFWGPSTKRIAIEPTQIESSMVPLRA